MIVSPKEIRQNYELEVGRWLPKCHANHEVCQTLWNLDADYAREIYKCCLSEPEYLEHYLRETGGQCSFSLILTYCHIGQSNAYLILRNQALIIDMQGI